MSFVFFVLFVEYVILGTKHRSIYSVFGKKAAASSLVMSLLRRDTAVDVLIAPGIVVGFCSCLHSLEVLYTLRKFLS